MSGTRKPPLTVEESDNATLSGAGELDPSILRYTRNMVTDHPDKGVMCHIVNVGSVVPRVETRDPHVRKHNTEHNLKIEVSAIAGGLEGTDTVTRLATLFGDDAPSAEFRPARHCLTAETRGGNATITNIKVEDNPKPIVDETEVVAMLKIKSTTTSHLNNFIGVATCKEDPAKTTFATKKYDPSASMDETHSVSIHGNEVYISTVLSLGTKECMTATNGPLKIHLTMGR